MNSSVDPAVLAGTSFARHLDETRCAVLAPRMRVVRVGPGEKLVEEGATARTLHVLVEGHMDAEVTAQGGHHETRYSMHPGDCAGITAFIDGTPREAALTARDACTLYALEPEALEELLGDHPRIVYDVLRGLFHARLLNLAQLFRENEQLSNYVRSMHGRY